MLQDITSRVAAAKENAAEAETLLLDYLPFIKKQLAPFIKLGMEYDDMLSIAMVAFTRAITQYDPERGAFLAYVQVAIRSRLTDEVRRSARKPIPVEDMDTAAYTASLENYDRESERRDIAAEIAELNAHLSEYSISFAELTVICPQQKRSRRHCLAAARHVTSDAQLLPAFRQNGRLPAASILRGTNIPGKTLEKYRKYIVALVTILAGDYPCIRSFIMPREEASI